MSGYGNLLRKNQNGKGANAKVRIPCDDNSPGREEMRINLGKALKPVVEIMSTALILGAFLTLLALWFASPDVLANPLQ